MAMLRKALLMPFRFGRPKLKLDAPQVELTLSLAVQPAQDVHNLAARLIDGAHRHDQRINEYVAAGNSMVFGALDDLLGNRETFVRVFRDPGLVIGNSYHRGAVFFHQRQHRFQPLLLASHGVDQGLALVGRESRLQRGDDG